MIVVPYESVGDLLFSDSREEIRKKLNEPYTFGIKGKGEYKDFYDYFNKSEIFVYYDEKNNVKAFEFFKANPTFNKIDLLNITYNKLLSFFIALDSKLIESYNDFVSLKFGIGANTAEDPDNKNAVVEAVIIFRVGYYDALNLM